MICISTSHTAVRLQRSALLMGIKLGPFDLSGAGQCPDHQACRPAFVFSHSLLPRVLWGKDKGVLGGQREAWWAAEIEGEGNEENKAPRASAVITQQQRECKTSGNNEGENEWAGQQGAERLRN